MANETFEHVVKQLKKNQSENSSGLDAVGKTVAGLNDRLNKFFEGLAQQRLDDLEDRREKRKEANKVAAAGGTTSKDTKGIGFLPLLFSKTGLVGTLLAVGGALAGLRGWEAGALKAIGKIKIGLTDNLTKSFRSLRASVLTGLGLDATLKKFNNPSSGLKTPITTQILDKFKGLKTSILKVFGLGADGKPIVVRGADGKFKTPIVSKITSAVRTLLAPLKFVSDGITTFFKTSGKGIMSFLKTIGIIGGGGVIAVGAGVGGVLKVLGRVLWPIGILTSIFEGFQAYQGSDAETKIGKFADGIAGAIGSFLGAPLDLLKSLILGGFKMVGIGVKMNDKGELVETEFMEMLQKFKIQDAIAAIPNAIRRIFEFIGDFIADPVGVGQAVLKTVVNSLKNFFLNAVKFIISKFPLMSAVAPDFLKTEGQKKISDLQEQKRLLTGELTGRMEGMRLAGGESKRIMQLREAEKQKKEIERIEEMLRTGNFEKSIFGRGINSAEEARTRLAQLQQAQEVTFKNIRNFSAASQQIITMTDQLRRTERDIAELAVALKNNPNLVVDNKDLSSTTNNSYTNSQAMIAADNLGFNTQNFEFRPVR